MAITISGENNNDRILAQDGVIDQISGINIVGVLTATSFVGNVTGNVTGNLTGNVNSTSPLLLQTGGSERFRITGNNELGIAGANYGSSGQVLTSGGSGSAVSWTTIPTQVTITSNADNRIITGGSGTNLVGESELTYTGGLLKVAATYPSFYLDDTNTTNNRFRIIHNNELTQIDADPNNVYAGSFINISVDGSERLRITSEGNVIIAETMAVNRPRIVLSAPNDGTNYRHLFGANLQVNSSGTFTTPTANISGGGWEYLPANSLNAHGQIRYLSAPDTNATSSTPLERLRIDATGRVLIGVDAATNSDSYVQAFKQTGNDATITVGNVATSASGLCRYDFAPSNKVVGSRIECHATEDFSTSANRTADLVFITRLNGTLSEKVRIDSSGKIGMGDRSTSASNTCDPDGNQLLIRGASTFQTTKGHIMLTGDSATVGQGPQIVFSESGSGSNNAGAYIGHVRQGSNSIGDLVFGTRATSGDANTVPTERLRIRSDGEIVINHTQASTPLNNTFISIWDANSDSSAIDASGISKNYAMISLHNYGTGVSGDTTGIGFGAGSAFSYTKGSIAFQRTGSYGTGDLVFLTNNDQNTTMVNDTDEKMRITRSGRVGIKNNLSDTFNSNANTLCIGDGGGAVGITFYTAASADGSHISFTETTGSTSEGMISYYQGSYSTANDRDCMIFRANSSERFRITKHGVTQFRAGYTNSTNSTSTWITLFTFSDGNTNGFSMVCAVAENSYTTMYRVAGSPYWNSSYFTSDYAGDSQHNHSSDITFRILNDSGTKRLQFKAVSYTTTRQLTVISVWLKNGYAIWA